MPLGLILHIQCQHDPSSSFNVLAVIIVLTIQDHIIGKINCQWLAIVHVAFIKFYICHRSTDFFHSYKIVVKFDANLMQKEYRG